MDDQAQNWILSINGGSSSIKFAVYCSRLKKQAMDKKRASSSNVDSNSKGLQLVVRGEIERIGLAHAQFTIRQAEKNESDVRSVSATNRSDAAQLLMDWIDSNEWCEKIKAIGHRLVHGGPNYCDPVLIDESVMCALRSMSAFDPEHLPEEIELIEALQQRYPHKVQIACFDTGFHHNMPRVAAMLSIPRRFEKLGVKRYGFHGLSYGYLMKELQRTDPVRAKGKVILAHLGNGASLAAVQGGHPMDTSMGFTPSSGVMMSTRSGDVDPGLVAYLAKTTNMDADEFHRMVHFQSGLLGVSEISSDMRDLIAISATDPRALDAIELFCYQVKKWIGSFAAAMGGVDALIFSGGIGEHSPLVRGKICQGLEFLGISLLRAQNEQNTSLISSGPTQVRVIKTDEEAMIAHLVQQQMNYL